MASSLRLLLGGDLMLGRGLDQCLAHHCDPALEEPLVRDARHYVALAEARDGPIVRPMGAADPWGVALEVMETLAPDLRLVNLETAMTQSGRPWPGKAVHYRLHPSNVDVLKVARIDACCLANNHVLDWGLNGLAETLRTLRLAGIASVGAGLSLHQAQGPARLPLRGGGRLLLFAWALASSGVPPDWAALPDRPGVALLPGIDAGTAKWLARSIRRHRRAADRVVVALHWGGNWVPVVPEAHRWLARQLIDLANVDVVFGHSSHHPLPLEIHRGRLILYGCGDLLNDYEGLPAHAPWRSDLVCLYAVDLDPLSGALQRLMIHPFQLRGFRLRPARSSDRALLWRQMGLELAPAGWGGRDHEGAWCLRPLRSAIAAP